MVLQSCCSEGLPTILTASFYLALRSHFTWSSTSARMKESTGLGVEESRLYRSLTCLVISCLEPCLELAQSRRLGASASSSSSFLSSSTFSSHSQWTTLFLLPNTIMSSCSFPLLGSFTNILLAPGTGDIPLTKPDQNMFWRRLETGISIYDRNNTQLSDVPRGTLLPVQHNNEGGKIQFKSTSVQQLHEQNT